MNKFLRFLSDESGAVTVDWVVLTAAVVGLALMALAPVFTGTTNIAEVVGTSVSTVAIGAASE